VPGLGVLVVPHPRQFGESDHFHSSVSLHMRRSEFSSNGGEDVKLAAEDTEPTGAAYSFKVR
jgi:hypothetical protein